MSDNVLLECKNITKHFGLVHALEDVSITFERGKIHGLIGENGSGKSTLSSIISGLYTATKGMMSFEGEPWAPASTLVAKEQGIRMIVQEAGTIRNITVAENIFLGQEEKFRKGLFIDKSSMYKESRKALENIGVEDIASAGNINSLTIEMRKIVEIARAAYGSVKLLIIDETTTALSQYGRDILYKLMHRLRDENVGIILISHDFNELLEHCDLMTILRDGSYVGTVERKDFTTINIKQMMIGRELSDNYYRSDMEGYGDEVVLAAENITTQKELMNFSLELHKGEILGVGGLSECGMHTLGKALFGFEPVLSGRVYLQSRGLEIRDSETAVSNGMAYLSKDRDTESLALNAPVYENIASTGYSRNTVMGFIVSPKKERAYVDEEIDKLSIKCSSADAEVNTLSGGNKQKVVFGKWVARDSDILILDCPTRGVDIGVKAAMYDLITRMKQAGKSILMISEELTELIGMCDRILILKDGVETASFLRKDDPTESQIIEYMI